MTVIDKPTLKVDAIIGTKEWTLNGKFHREDGPAYIGATGTKVWCLNGKRHREDGPAIERADGTKGWWLNGEEVDPIVHFVRRKEFE